jgi:multiple sugar transport system ATP-binding protein
MAALEIERVEKTLRSGQTVLRDVSFAARDGELLAVVGPSGCGKSTLLRLVAGLDSMTAGVIRIGGRTVNELPPQQRDVAMVFQNHALYPHMTVYENLAFGLRVRGTPRAQIGERVRQAAVHLGLESMLKRFPRELSGGQRQRTALGRAMLRDPALFLLDEPLSSLDVPLRAELRRELTALHRSLGTTMVYVTHDQSEALSLGQRLVVLAGGRVQQIDTPINVYHRPANRFVAAFVGWPPMNFLTADAFADVTRVPSGEREFEYGVRPEAFSAQAGGPDDLQVVGRIERIESQGSECHLELTHRFGQVLARLRPEVVPRVGEQMRLWVKRGDLHAFDPVSGQRVELTEQSRCGVRPDQRTG